MHEIERTKSRVHRVRGLIVASRTTTQWCKKWVMKTQPVPQASLKLLLLLLELLKLGFSVRLVGIETAPAFSETHAESSLTSLKATLPLLFAERVTTARSHRELEAWCLGLFPAKVGSFEGSAGELGVGVFGGAFFVAVVLPLELEFSSDLVLMFISMGFDVVLLVVVP
jgi:hypothetical protein